MNGFPGNRRGETPVLAWLGLAGASLLVVLGTLRAFETGAPDFSVFFHGWKLVADGSWERIYVDSPDRFLYAPGFAWLLAPLAWLPKPVVLAAWCFLKAAILGYVIREFGNRLFRGATPLESAGLAAWGLILMAKPLLIDLQYGQVNLVILGVSAWALLRHFGAGKGSAPDLLSWALLAVAAVSKLYALPLLIVPWILSDSLPEKKKALERSGTLFGVALVFVLPLLGGGIAGASSQHQAWIAALADKGLPLESHNQSFAAFLHHFFSDKPTPVISAKAYLPLSLTWIALPEQTIRYLAAAWTFISAGGLLGWLLSAGRRPTLQWICIALAALILPSHLIWKPYFVMAIPLAAYVVSRYSKEWPLLIALFLATNLTGFDFIGPEWGARVESGAFLLWIELILIGLAIARPEPRGSEAI